MTSDTREWRWAGEDGAQTVVTEQQLIAELSSETLPSYTLVWRKGWLEWLPAMQIEELSWALPPGRADGAVKPRERGSAGQPPPPPLYRYPVLKRRAASLRSGSAPGPTAEAAKPAAPEPPTAVLVPAAAPSEARPADERPPPKPPDDVEDEDLDDLESSSPSASAGLPFDDDDDLSDLGAPRRPLGSSAVYVPPHAPPTSERPLPSFDDEVPVIPASPAPPADLSAYADEAARTVTRARRSPGRYWVSGAVAAVSALGIALALRAGRDRATEHPGSLTSAMASVAAGASGASPRPTGTCRATVAAMKLADAAEPAVQPLFAASPGSARLAVGYAESESKAVGLTIDPRTLDRDQVFHDTKTPKVASVVPTTFGGKLRFQVAREGTRLVSGRAVDASPPFSIASSPQGIVRVAGSDVGILWALPSEDTTIPRVATAASSHAVALRNGGKTGPILVGWVDEGGRKQTELRTVERTEELAGTPAIAVSQDGLLVAFAVRGAREPTWAIALASAKQRAAPGKAIRFAIPEGGPSGEAMSPSIAGLSGGRWLLTWTEGVSGNRSVRAQVLGADLAPQSSPMTVSPAGTNAGQSAAWADGASAIVLFYVQRGGGHELWGSALECMR